ncbi:MAG: tetraacyldisaccharide 4'-kinase [Casimicrobiaceae bacterium]
MVRPAFAPTFRERLQRDWYLSHSTLLTNLLWPLSWLYRATVALRRTLYTNGVFARRTLPVPVVVVGNIATGGTGKTPLVVWLAQALREHRMRPGIVARGYGGSNRAPRAVVSGDDPHVVGDESLLLAQAGCPVWIGHDRAAAASALLDAEPRTTVIISDDGLQHYRLARTLEIVVVDGVRGFGNARMLPAGPLREPRGRVTSVDAIVVNGLEHTRIPFITRPPMFTMMLDGDRFVRLVDPSQTAGAEAFIGKRVEAIAGIGHPARFFDGLRTLGLDPICHVFPDHHAYTAEDLALPEAEVIVMTDKDAIKCRTFADPRMWRLPVTATVAPGLVERLLETIHGR